VKTWDYHIISNDNVNQSTDRQQFNHSSSELFAVNTVYTSQHQVTLCFT